MDKQHGNNFSRRTFLRMGASLTAGYAIGGAYAAESGESIKSATEPVSQKIHRDAKVAIVPCKTYGDEVKKAYTQCFDLLGGIGSMVKNKTVTVKVNMTGYTGRDSRDPLGKPVGETYLTHGDTVIALASIFLEKGAKRIRVVECAYTRDNIENLYDAAGWDLDALFALGNIELENTRNLGYGKKYSTLPVPGGGYLFSSFEFNHSYEDTDVFVSLSKMKNHTVAGVTLAMKNVFGITPNTKYGGDAGSEDAVQGRNPLHGNYWRRRWRRSPEEESAIELPGAKKGDFPNHQGYRIPRIVVDVCAARPIHLSIIDGITSISGGEGPWGRRVKLTSPGVLIAGLNPVSTDAVGTAVMGYPNPRAEQGTAPFHEGDNHILLAEQCGLGCADLAKIEVMGASIEDVKYPYSA